MTMCSPVAFWLVLWLVSGTVKTKNEALQPSDNPCRKNKTVNLLVMAPFPDSAGLEPGRETGPIVIPASVVAVESINARCDMLGDYRIELLVADSGCNIISRAISNLVNITFDPHYQVVGVIGPSCSTTAIDVGAFLAHPSINLLHISPSATSLKLLGSKFPNSFRSLGSSLGFVTMYLALINDLQIKKVAILFEHVSSVQAAAANDFQTRILSDYKEVTVTIFGISSFFMPLEEIRNKFRLVFVFGGEYISRQLLCLAFHRKMVYPDYQFIFSEIILKDLLSSDVFVSVDGETLMCTARRVREINSHQTGYYDSVWAFALALIASMPRLDSELGVSLDNYTFGHGRITEIVHSELLEVRFEGTRGRVEFSKKTLDGENVTRIIVIRIGLGDFQQSIVGEFDPTLPEVERISISLQSAFIPDSFNQMIIAPPVYVEIVVLLIVAMVIVILAIFHFVDLKLTGTQSLKVTSPLLNNLIYFGCYLYLLSILFVSFNKIVGDQNPVIFAIKCGGYMWCESIAFSLIFGTIAVKSWRILCIFSRSSSLVVLRARKRKERSNCGPLNYLDTHFLVLYVSAVVLIDIAFQISWNVTDPWFMKKEIADVRQIYLSCGCDHLNIWIPILLAQKAILTCVVVYLSIATRNISRQEYKQTKSANTLVYVYIFIHSMLFASFILFLNSKSTLFVTLSYLSICLKNILCVMMCIILVFWPPVFPILKGKWKAIKS